jgi:hypothetical protein
MAEPATLKKSHRRIYLKKRTSLAVIASVGILALALVLVLSPLFALRATTYATKAGNRVISTINGLTRITVVGSTAFIVDQRGRTIAVDSNPYGVTIVPPNLPSSNTPGTLKAGDMLVSNIGDNDTGTTLVRFPQKGGPGSLFNTVANPGTKGPNAEVFNTLSGNLWVANASGNDVQVFKPTGSVLLTITNQLFHKPWGLAFNHGVPNRNDGSVAAFFVTNVADATIDRIEIIPGRVAPSFRVSQIGQLARSSTETKIAVTWVPSLRLRGTIYPDVLLAIDGSKNRIAAFPNSSTRHATTTGAADNSVTVFQESPLNAPIGFTFNPLNGDLLVVNQNDNNLVELNLSQRKVVGTRVLDNVPVDAQTGNGSALIGVTAHTDVKGNLEVFFTDDNTNTLDVLST